MRNDFLTILWSIWRCHYKIVFHWDTFDVVGCLELCRLNLARWVKVRWGDLVSSITDMIRCLESFDILRKIMKGSRNWVWTHPDSGQIKANVDGSFLGAFGRGGIGGVFRDSNGGVLVQFEKEVAVDFCSLCKVASFEGKYFRGCGISVDSISLFLVRV